jgi:hypothetical protein
MDWDSFLTEAAQQVGMNERAVTVVQERDPKGLYAKVAAGQLKGFTGVDDPYEPPLNAEINMKNYEMTIQESVDVLMRALVKEGCLVGGPTLPEGLPYPDGDEIIEEMKSGNYENLVATFDKYFGDYVILERLYEI